MNWDSFQKTSALSTYLTFVSATVIPFCESKEQIFPLILFCLSPFTITLIVACARIEDNSENYIIATIADTARGKITSLPENEDEIVLVNSAIPESST